MMGHGRFRSIYSVGAVAVAALACYLLAQHVAGEHAALARTELAIVATKRDIRVLQTEITTRAGMNQIERWNRDVLALSAPKASQFLASEVQLAALAHIVPPAMAAAGHAVRLVADVRVRPAVHHAPQVLLAVRAMPIVPAMAKLIAAHRPAKDLAPPRNSETIAVLDDKLLGDISRLSATERAGRRR